MFKNKTILCVLLTIVFFAGKAYCLDGEKTIFGSVMSIDVEGGNINVKTANGEMVFYLLAESGLFRSTHHMASIEITPGDKVKIKYFIQLGQNKIISLVDNSSKKY
jgi:hypothetical protein